MRVYEVDDSKKFFKDNAKAQRRCWLCDEVIDIGEDCLTAYIKNEFNGYTKVNLHLNHLNMKTVNLSKYCADSYKPTHREVVE